MIDDDHYAARIDTLEAKIDRLDAQLAGADASHRRAEAENDRLRAELAELNGELARMQRARNDALAKAERFRAKHEECQDCELTASIKQQLAAANALLERNARIETQEEAEQWVVDLDSHLAGAEAPERAECEFGPHCPACREERGDNARTEAEQRVLDAARVWWETRGTQPLYDALLDLEQLARRGLKP